MVHEIKTRMIPQKDLTSECWTVQMQGLGACKTCPYRGTKECGGKNIIRTMRNLKGKRVPLGKEIL